MLVVERTECLSTSAAVEHFGAKRTFVHLLEQRSEESLRDPDLGLAHELVVL
jgi:hypothetical protein